MVSIEYSEALSEIDDILNHLNKDLIDKIPQKFKKFVSSNKSKTYKPVFDHTKSLKDLHLKEKTVFILSVIYMNFLCDEESKKEYIKTLKNNSIKKEEERRKKYNPDNLFKNRKYS